MDEAFHAKDFFQLEVAEILTAFGGFDPQDDRIATIQKLNYTLYNKLYRNDPHEKVN